MSSVIANNFMTVVEFIINWPAAAFLMVFFGGLGLFLVVRPETHVSKSVDSLIPRFLVEYIYWIAHQFVGVCRALHLTPNRITALSAILAAGAGYALAMGKFQLGAQISFFALGFDVLDGHLARELDMRTESGAFLDSFVDRVSEGFLFFGIAVYGGGSLLSWLAFGTVMASFLVSYARARGEALGASYSGGWMQRPERVVTLLVAIFFAPVIANWFSAITVDGVLIATLALIGSLSTATVFRRVGAVMSILDARKPERAQTEVISLQDAVEHGQAA